MLIGTMKQIYFESFFYINISIKTNSAWMPWGEKILQIFIYDGKHTKISFILFFKSSLAMLFGMGLESLCHDMKNIF